MDMPSAPARLAFVILLAVATAGVAATPAGPAATPSSTSTVTVVTYDEAPPAVPIPAPTISSTTTTTAPATTTTTTSAPSPTTAVPATTTPEATGPVPLLRWDRAVSCDFAVQGDTPGLGPVLEEITALSGIGFYPSESADPNTAGIVVRHGPAPGNPTADGMLHYRHRGNVFVGGELWITARGSGDPTLLYHELGHALGLDHHAGTVMAAGAAESKRHPGWNASERAAITAFGERTGCR